MQEKDFVKVLSPRVACLIVSKNCEGKINAAPYSFVYPISFEPPLIGIGVGKHKMTFKNIAETKEFTVNVISENFAQQAVNCEEKIKFDKRIEKNQLHLEESEKISVPRIAESKAVMECVLSEVIELKEADHVIVIGKVLGVKAAKKDEMIDIDSMNYLMHETGGVFRKVGEKVLLERIKKK
ncbi:flavin reductase family protein [Candidatus Micrarchaeota archaeon]|nr:flavin reductase family protein [Candidatus Micrarchaeota archaeon]MBU2476038.1 flavin reductase family protein [Candidatus Micrarchaeota archaeon]